MTRTQHPRIASRTAWLGPLGLGARQGTDPHPVPLCLGTCVTRCQNPLTPTSPWYPHPPGTCIPWYPDPPAPTSPWHPYPLVPPSLRTDCPRYLQPPALLPSGPLTQVPPFPQDSQHHGTLIPLYLQPPLPTSGTCSPWHLFPPCNHSLGHPLFSVPPVPCSHSSTQYPHPWSPHRWQSHPPGPPHPPGLHIPQLLAPPGPHLPGTLLPGTSIPP